MRICAEQLTNTSGDTLKSLRAHALVEQGESGGVRELRAEGVVTMRITSGREGGTQRAQSTPNLSLARALSV